jgi:hypothetical protein
MRILTAVVSLIVGCRGAAPVGPDAAEPDATAAPPPSTLDDSFGEHGRLTRAGDACVHLGIDASDRPILLVSDAAGQAKLARYTASGQLDAAFGRAGEVAVGSSATPLSRGFLFVLPSGKLLVIGLTPPDTSPSSRHAYRFSADGVPDAGFGVNGDLSLPDGYIMFAAGERSDGGIDLAAMGATTTFSFLRIAPSGTLDTSFGTAGVAEPATGNIPPGYFTHGAYVADGTFVLSGATFASVGSGTGPITGHLVVVGDGMLVDQRTDETTQYLSLVNHTAGMYALDVDVATGHGLVTRRTTGLAGNAGFAAPVSLQFSVVFGLNNGGALAVAPDGSFAVTNAGGLVPGDASVARFGVDGKPTHVDAFDDLLGRGAYFCELAYDSTGRPVIATSTSQGAGGVVVVARLER